jgi:hypothetical protein
MKRLSHWLWNAGLDPQSLKQMRANALAGESAEIDGAQQASPGGLLHGLVPTPVRNHIGRMGMKEASAVERGQLDSRQGGAVAFGARAVGNEVPVYIAPRTGRTASDPGADTNAGLRTGMVPANQNQGPKRTHAPVLRGAVPLVVVWG